MAKKKIPVAAEPREQRVRLDLNLSERRILEAAAECDSRSLAVFARLAVMEVAERRLRERGIDPEKLSG
jgi:uncharacterized protein (DUF1778 family)